MAWRTGLTWTHGYKTDTINPDGTRYFIGVHGGPFLFINNRWLYLYAGFRPTPPWGPGYGDEGILGKRFARWMKVHGWGNLGIALRRGHGA